MPYTKEEIDARLLRIIHQPLLEDAVFGTVTLASLYSSLGGTKETLAAMQILGIVPENATIVQLEQQIEGYQHDPESFRGLLSTVKGRVAEIRQIETLNSSPEFQANGWHAVFAPTTNYPGVDIFVLDQDGVIIDAQQIKTGSLDYVRQAYEEAQQQGLPVDFYAPSDVAPEAGVNSLNFTNAQLERDVYHDLSGLAAFGDALPVASMGIAGVHSIMENTLLVHSGAFTWQQAGQNIAVDTLGAGLVRGLCAQGGAALLAGMVGLSSPWLLPLAIGGGLLGGFLGGNLARELAVDFHAHPGRGDYNTWLQMQAAKGGRDLMLSYQDLGREATQEENLVVIKKALAMPAERATGASTAALMEKRELETQDARGTLSLALAEAHHQKVTVELKQLHKWQFTSMMKLDQYRHPDDLISFGREVFQKRDLGLIGSLRFNYFLATTKKALGDFLARIGRVTEAK